MKKLSVFLASLLFLGLSVVQAQTVRITGTVTSSEDGMPLPGVSVFVKGTTVGVTTNIDGKYDISVSAKTESLSFSFVGYETQDAAIAGRTVIDVVLKPESVQMQEVVVVGYGVMRKTAFTGSAATISEKELSRKTDADPIRALQATVPGLSMDAETGQPGGYNSVLIRGLGSFNSGTQPLYVVDGVPITTGNFGMRNDESQSVSPLATLNPSDIESVSVLKDASATSIYGARAANGVIVITTKKGKSGKTQFSLKVKQGISTIPARNNYKQLNRTEWIDFLSTMCVNTGWLSSKSDWSDDMLSDPSWFGLVHADANTDWYKEVTRTGTVKDYNLDISGGNDNTKFFISGGYYDETGIVIGKDMKRYSARTNFENKVNKNVKLGFNLNGSYSQINNGAGGGYFSDPITMAYMMLPVEPVKLEDGSWNMETVNGYNPVAQRSKYGDKSYDQQFKATFSPWVSINFLKDFTFMSRYGMDYYNLKEFGRWSMLQPQGADMGMLGEQGNDYRTLWTWTNTVNYVKTFGKHNLNILLGQEVQKSRDEDSYLAGSNYPVDIVETIENAANPESASTSYANYALSSVFSRFEYDYSEKYYLSASFRYDGSSRFGANNKWAPFWSVGGKYRISNEEFMSSTKSWLNSLSLRSSIGTSGNQDVGWYQALGLYGFGYNYQNNPGMIPTQIANPDLKWEQTQKFNVGFDMRLLNSINIGFDYYVDRTTNMLFNVPLSRVTGFESIMKNVGEMKNSGYELQIIATPIHTTNFVWAVNLNATHNKNEIVKLSTDLPIENTYTIREVGRPYNTFKMKEYAGVDPQTGQQLWYKGTEGKETTTNYNEAGKRYLGSADPKLYGGFGTSITYKNFDLSLQFKYSFGGKVYNSSARYDENVSNPWGNTTKYVYDNMWREPGDITDVPAPTYGIVTSHSSRFLMDGSYIKLNTIQLGYNLPKSLISKLNISNVRVYVSGDNLKTWALGDDFRGLDPETSRDGIIWWQYPQARKVLFGVNIDF